MSEQKEIGRISLSETEDLVASVVDDEKLDLRIWIKGDEYNGFTKRGVRFFFFDGNWERFKALLDKVDKVHEDVS